MNRSMQVNQIIAGTLLCLCALSPAHALYKVVGPDGKITYTDRPPTDSGQVRQLSSSGQAQDNSSPLPFELRQLSSRFPVTVYTAPACQPCDAVRSLFQQRGVPYTERSVSTAEDIQAYAKLVPTNQLPMSRIGSQQVLGYSADELNAYLDAAGYPKQSRLPARYQFAEATPLAPAKTAAPATNVAPAATSLPPRPSAESTPPTPAPLPGNAPPGFTF